LVAFCGYVSIHLTHRERQAIPSKWSAKLYFQYNNDHGGPNDHLATDSPRGVAMVQPDFKKFLLEIVCICSLFQKSAISPRRICFISPLTSTDLDPGFRSRRE
jgi:hypothetical protein